MQEWRTDIRDKLSHRTNFVKCRYHGFMDWIEQGALRPYAVPLCASISHAPNAWVSEVRSRRWLKVGVMYVPHGSLGVAGGGGSGMYQSKGW